MPENTNSVGNPRRFGKYTGQVPGISRRWRHLTKKADQPPALGSALVAVGASAKTAGRVLDGRTWDEWPEVGR